MRFAEGELMPTRCRGAAPHAYFDAGAYRIAHIRDTAHFTISRCRQRGADEYGTGASLISAVSFMPARWRYALARRL